MVYLLRWNKISDHRIVRIEISENFEIQKIFALILLHKTLTLNCFRFLHEQQQETNSQQKRQETNSQ